MTILYEPEQHPHAHMFTFRHDVPVGTVARCDCGQHAVVVNLRNGRDRGWLMISNRKAERLLRRARNRTGVV